MQQDTSDNQKGYRRLIVWQKADELAFQVYIITKKFPKEELFSLVSQMRRAALSVPANKVQFYNIAKGSLTEIEYYLDFSLRLGYLNENLYDLLVELRNEVGRLLNGFIKSTK